MLDVTPRSAARAAWAAAATNVAAALGMALLLMPGLPVEGSVLADRMAYVALHPWRWGAGWLLWHGATIGLLAFYVGLAGQWARRAPILCTLALLCATAGLGADLSAQSLTMSLAARLPPEGFAALEDGVGALSGYLGNGLYTVAGILLTAAGARDLPRALVVSSAVPWLAGLALSAAVLARSPAGQVASTAVLFPTFVLWTVLVGRWLATREPAERPV